MNINEAGARKSPWVFGAAEKDIFVFMVPLGTAVILHVYFGSAFASLKQNLTIYGFLHFGLNVGHIYGTWFPILLDGKLREKVGPVRMLIPILIVLLFGIVCFFSVALFKKLLGFLTLFHILSQHYNWLRVLQKRESLSRRRQIWERFVFLSLVVVGISTWISGRIAVAPSYLHENDIRINYEFLDLRYLIWPATLVWAMCMVGLVLDMSRLPKAKSYGKLLLFSTLYPWIFGSLLFLESGLMFFVYALSSHALGYYVYLGYGWNRAAGAPTISKYLPIVIPPVCAIVAVLWNEASLFVLTIVPPRLYFLTWTPVILHYLYDGTLWRRTKRESSVKVTLSEPTRTVA